MQLVIKLFTSGKRSLPSSVGIAVGVLFFLLRHVVSNENLNKDSEKSETWNITALERLHTQLFTNYDKSTHPTQKGEPTDVAIGITVINIDIDEMNGKMTLHGWLGLYWTDDNRAWNASEYDNIKIIHALPSQIWKPDVTLFNGAGSGSISLGETPALINSNGNVFWIPPVVLTVYCNFNFINWPFDTQSCDLKIGTWSMIKIRDSSYKYSQVDIDGIYKEVGEWVIIENKTSLHTKDHHSYNEFSFLLERRSSMYTAVIFTPASCIVLLALSVFWLPPQMGEKILLNGIVIVVIAAFLMYFAQLLPILAENTPLVVLFYSSSLLLLSISTIIAVIVLYLSTAKHKRRIPDFLKNLLNGWFGKILCLSQFSLESEPHSLLNNGTKELGEHVYENPDDEIPDPLDINPVVSPSARSIQFEWILLATAVDRICFFFYCIIFICLAITYSV